jgi:NitT/TauT family transport system substrate-binding protein
MRISKSDDSCIANPEIPKSQIGLVRNDARVNSRGPICNFGFYDLQCRNRSISKFIALALLAFLLLSACSTPTDSPGSLELRIPRGAGGVGFLPLLIMERNKLVEKHAAAAGLDGLQVRWIELGGPSTMNDALLSGAVDFIAAGPPAFLVLWDRTRDSAKVHGVAAMTSLPMYLNTTNPKLNSLDDLTDKDKIAMTAIKVSIPAIVMQMAAAEKYGLPEAARYDKYTVSMTHPDGVVALLGGSGAVSAHFTSPPFHQRERKDARVRTIMTSDDVMKGSTTFTMLSTTAAFRERHPKVVAAVLAALEEANESIRNDKTAAANHLLTSTTESGFSLDELLEVIGDPAVKFTTTPENVMKYAEFMHRIGTLKTLPASWKDLFFEEIHGAPGN